MSSLRLLEVWLQFVLCSVWLHEMNWQYTESLVEWERVNLQQIAPHHSSATIGGGVVKVLFVK